MNIERLEKLMAQTAASLGRSLDVYWPSDATGRNDPCERNLSIHFGHVLLNAGFSVFAEAAFAGRNSRLDVLGIAPGEEWFLAGEFKKLYGAPGMGRSIDDLNRVVQFRLNPDFQEQVVGPRRMATLQICTQGIGVLAGLRWMPGASAPSRDSIRQSQLGATIVEQGGEIGEPILVRANDSVDSRGSYYLQYAMVPIDATCITRSTSCN